MIASYLLDVNVLISLLYAGHEHHERASSWFAQSISQEQGKWLSCPTTENGAIRLLGKASICSPPYAPLEVAERLATLAEAFPHRFLPEDLSLVRDPRVALARVRSSGQVTDIALVALAHRHGAVLATMDRRIDPAAVLGGQDAYLIIP